MRITRFGLKPALAPALALALAAGLVASTAAEAQVTRPGVPWRDAPLAGKVPGTTAAPRGYRPVWEDGRLNPRRAEGTARGEAAMRRLWTDTVPMRTVE